MANKYISIRIDEILLHKLHIVAQYELRSTNSEIIFLIREVVEKFEKEHGKIDFLRWITGRKFRPVIFCVNLKCNFSVFIRWTINTVHYLWGKHCIVDWCLVGLVVKAGVNKAVDFVGIVVSHGEVVLLLNQSTVSPNLVSLMFRDSLWKASSSLVLPH